MPSNTIYNPYHTKDFVKIALQYDAVGVTQNAAAGTTTNIDHTVTDDVLLTGAQVLANIPNFGDSMIFQIVDTVGILAPAGTILDQYVTNWQCRSDFQEQIDINNVYPAKIPAGLCLRLIYTSTGTSAVAVAVNYMLHKVLQ